MAWQDDCVATLNELCAQRLAVIKAGPSPSYSVHGHTYKWTEYLEYLDKAIDAVRIQIAQGQPFEFVSRGR